MKRFAAIAALLLAGLSWADAGSDSGHHINQKAIQVSLKKCPADVMAPAADEAPFKSMNCSDGMATCEALCSLGKGNACLSLAYTLQKTQTAPEASESYFEQSCELGVTNGCTNRAAGMLYYASDKSAKGFAATCAAQTFRKACERNDPWGCTMYAESLMANYGVSFDEHEARQALGKSCRFGEEDPACQKSHQLLKKLNKQ